MIWTDASALIAMARIGRLNVLRDCAATLHTTSVVYDEAAIPGFPETEAIAAARQAGWLAVVTVRPRAARFGLGPGEASIITKAAEDDLLILDDAPARRAAIAAGKQVTGLLGLLVAAARKGRIDKQTATLTVRDLAQSDFRMTTALYDWCLQMLADL